MIPERDYFLAKLEVEARRQRAAEERVVREARHASETPHTEQVESDEQPRGAFEWLRRLAGARQ